MPEHKNTQSSNAFEDICEFSTLVELLRYRSSQQAKQLSYTFLSDGETESDRLTYQELDTCSRAIASQLQSLGLSGERALLLYPPGLEYLAAFFGCLYAGVVAVPAYPPRNQRNTPRILAILEDAQAAIILTTTGILSQVQSLFADKFDINNIHWLATNNLASGIEEGWRKPPINTDTLAFLQYTSGSTGTPKGVMLSHGNLLHNAVVTRQYMEHSSSSKFVTWLPVYHDMGLIGGVLQPLYGGFPCIMMPPAAFLQRPYRWLEAISRYRGTTSGAPNFAYELCIEKITPEQRSTLDLSSWNIAFNGAEPIRQETLEKFAHTFAECGFRPEAFYPCYGMAEATLMVSGSVKNALVRTKTLQKTALESNHIIDAAANEENSIALVGCGRSVPQQQIAIANPETLTRCEPNEIGEIWVSGPSIGHGYWNRPEETEQTFHAYLQDTGVQRSAHENSEALATAGASGSFLRTGDLGFLHNGELFITGRAKDLIIIRGRNLYPQDIELTAERSHKTLRATSVAAFAVEVEKEECLVVVQELEFRAKPNIDEVTAAIRQAITEEHEVQVYAVVLIKAGTIPKTSSGKIQRRATKAGFLAGTLEVVGSSILEIAQTTAAEDCLTRTELLAVEAEQRQQLLNSYLQKLVAQVLRVAPSQLDLQQPLSSSGLDSLKVFELKNRIEVDFGVAVSVADFFGGAGIAELATQILDQVNSNLISAYLPISKVDTAANQHPLTFTQQQLWFINQLQPGTATYNIPVAIHLTGKLNVSALVRSLNEIIQRHDILRTSFEVVDGEPIQKVADLVALTLPEIDLRHLADEQQQTEVQKLSQQEAQSSFDLRQAPLLRAKLLHLQAESILLINVHHLVGDGWSIKILVQELSTIYQAFCADKPSQLPQLRVQYTDFVYWQRNWLQGEVIEKHLAYWKQQLGGNLPVLQLPTDRPRPPIQTFRGAQQKFVLSTTLTESIKQLSQEKGTTLFMTLLAAFQTLLYRYAGQEDILVGSPIANRNHAELDQLIGCFVNTLVLRTNLEGNPTFTELLGRVRKVAVEVYTHQDLPFEKLVEALQPNRDLSYNPLFQVMFVLQNPAASSIWKTEELETGTAKFDILLSMIDSEQGLTGTLEYNTDLFNSDTIARMVGHFQTLLEGVVSDPNQGISELSILTPVERQTLLVDWNNTQVDYPQEACIHNLFEAQAEKTPDAIALIFANLKLTYRELNNRANQLAHYLQNVGVQPETLVGICMERSLEMVIGILAVLKAGAAYVPLDPIYPVERLSFVLEDAQLKFILTQQKQSHKLANDKTQLICLDTDGEIIAQQSTDNPNSQVIAASLAYIIYTSGSTGKPKGVLVNHANVVRLFAATDAWFKFNQQDVWTLFHSIAFDFSVWEIWGALLYGGSLVVVPYQVSRSPQAFYELLAQQQVTVLNQTPSAFRQLIQVDESVAAAEKLKHIKYVIFGGEALELQSLQPWFERYGDKSPQLVNMYGITETTVHVTYRRLSADVTQAQGSVIGSPIPDLQVYLLDKHQQLVPIGVPGEMYIGGAGLARGYLNRSELTQQKFISHPFAPKTRLYRSGDLARYLPNGELEYLGRIDNQVKIRGFRIELGEIETTLSQYPKVREAVVLVREDIANDRRLVAYIVPEQKSPFFVDEFRHFLKEKMPEYMIPSAFVVLESLPLTSNGKVDHRALPAPENLRPELATNYQAPQSEIEKTIAKVWKQVLQIEKVGIHDNFFDLGGHSLLVVQVNNQLRETLKQDLSIVEMFQNPTIKSLAQYLGTKAETVSSFESMRDRAKMQRDSLNRQKKLLTKPQVEHEGYGLQTITLNSTSSNNINLKA